MNERWRWRICVHEAGHALVARLVGVRVRRCTVRSDMPSTSWEDSDHLADIMALCGGYCAEIVILRSANMFDSDTDMEKIKRLRQGRFSLAEVLDMQTETEAILHTHRDALRAIATALYFHETLDGRAIDALISGPFFKGPSVSAS